jgi:hypothetical protein
MNETVLMSIEKTLAGLVKNNGGFFKTAKQADFILSNCALEDGTTTFSAHGSVYNNPYTIVYHLDSDGVVTVVKSTLKANKNKKVWERKVAGTISIQDQKQIKGLKRRIKEVELSIKNRENSKQTYIDRGMMNLYQTAMETDQKLLEGLMKTLQAFGN